MSIHSISKDHPVENGDVAPIARHRNLTTMDVQWVLGMGSSESLSSKTMDEPIKEVQRAFILRLLAIDPSSNLLPRTPTVDEVLALCEGCDPSFTKRDFGVLMGRQGASTYRWLAKSGDQTTSRVLPFSGERWMTMIHRVLSQATTVAARRVKLNELRQLVFDEAEARGFDREILLTRYQWVERE